MKRRLLFILAVFCATVALMAVQKPVFLLWYARQAAEASAGEWWQVVANGLKLDLTVAGYITAFPLLVTLLSLWIPLSGRIWRRIFRVYFWIVALFAAAVFAVDIALYEHWGFRLDGTVLIYLSDPREVMASVDFWLGVRQVLFFAACAALMGWVYMRVVRLFDGDRVGVLGAIAGSLAMVMLSGFDFLAIRGGMEASVANVSKVYFSSNMFLNHAATNPIFSFLSTLGNKEDYASAYPFFDEQARAARFEALRGNSPGAPAEKVLRTTRPNVVIVVLEGFGRTIMDAEAEGKSVMPNMQRLKSEGVWFENFYANSFRTDRGQVAVLSGFPAQTQISVMKLPSKSGNLPSIARSLGREGYATSFTYGGDLNFTNQASYLYATGWQKLEWQKGLRFDTPPADWGYDDAVMCDYFAREVIAQSASGEPFLAGLLTLSSHTPFDVPYKKFENKILNSMAFSDECVGRMIDTLKASPAWDDLLVVLVADHGYPYPLDTPHYASEWHRIPMLWLGGALTSPRVVEDYASQIDLCATLLAQMDIAHDDFDYSKDIFDPSKPKFGYYVFVDGFGVVDASGAVVWDNTGGTALVQTSPGLLDVGRTMLQTTYVDIGRR